MADQPNEVAINLVLSFLKSIVDDVFRYNAIEAIAENINRTEEDVLGNEFYQLPYQDTVAAVAEAWDDVEEDDLSKKLQSIFGVLKEVEMVFVARAAIRANVMISNKFKLVTVFLALKKAGYELDVEDYLDLEPINAFLQRYQISTKPIREQLQNLKTGSASNKEAAELVESIMASPATFVKSAHTGNYATAKFSRAQIIEALRKTGANPKLAAARLLRG